MDKMKFLAELDGFLSDKITNLEIAVDRSAGENEPVLALINASKLLALKDLYIEVLEETIQHPQPEGCEIP